MEHLDKNSFREKVFDWEKNPNGNTKENSPVSLISMRIGVVRAVWLLPSSKTFPRSTLEDQRLQDRHRKGAGVGVDFRHPQHPVAVVCSEGRKASDGHGCTAKGCICFDAIKTVLNVN